MQNLNSLADYSQHSVLLRELKRLFTQLQEFEKQSPEKQIEGLEEKKTMAAKPDNRHAYDAAKCLQQNKGM